MNVYCLAQGLGMEGHQKCVAPLEKLLYRLSLKYLIVYNILAQTIQ